MGRKPPEFCDYRRGVEPGRRLGRGSDRKLTHCPLSDVAGSAAETRSRKIRDLRGEARPARLNKSRVKRPNSRRLFSLDRRAAARTRRQGPARTSGLRGGRQREPGSQRPSVPCGSQLRPWLSSGTPRPRGVQSRPWPPADPCAPVDRGEKGGRARPSLLGEFRHPFARIRRIRLHALERLLVAARPRDELACLRLHKAHAPGLFL